MALEGSLQDFSLADMFRLIASGCKTGVLHIAREGAEAMVCFREGRVFFASSSAEQEPLGKRLVRAGVISEKQLRQALGLQKIQKQDQLVRRLGQILIVEGYLEEQVLEEFVQEQINDTLFELFRWQEGQLRFDASDECMEEDIGISVSVESVITEAARHFEMWERIKERVPSMRTRFVMAASPGEKSAEIHLKPREWMLLCHLHGGRSAAELSELTGYNEFETAKALYEMSVAGLVERVGAPDDGPATE